MYEYARGECCCDLQYDVVLYECDESRWCCDDCDLIEVASNSLTSVSTPVISSSSSHHFSRVVVVLCHLNIFSISLGWL